MMISVSVLERQEPEGVHTCGSTLWLGRDNGSWAGSREGCYKTHAVSKRTVDLMRIYAHHCLRAQPQPGHVQRLSQF